MRVHVVPHTRALKRRDLSAWTVVVIDAVRATSTIAQAVASGCRTVVPVASIAAARAYKRAHKGDAPLLGGERGGLKIAGFDLGNSPEEYHREAVAGRTVVLTTTNGTRALEASRDARETLAGAFLNLPAIVRYLAGEGHDVLLAPAGRQDAPVLDDVVCAGMFVDGLLESGEAALTSEAHLAHMAYRGYRGRIEQALRESASGQALARIGLDSDLAYCAQVGLLDVVPRLIDGEIRAKERG